MNSASSTLDELRTVLSSGLNRMNAFLSNGLDNPAIFESTQDEATRKRELEGLVKFNQFMRVKKNIILTYEEEYSLKAEGIEVHVIPVYKWLLDGEGA